MPAKEAYGSGGPKGGTPYVRQDGAKSGPQSLSQRILIIVIPCVICSFEIGFRRRSPTSNCLNHNQHHGNDRREDSTLAMEMGIQPLRLCSGTHKNSRRSILKDSRNHCVVCHVRDRRLYPLPCPSRLLSWNLNSC